jgi:hypothetical protein
MGSIHSFAYKPPTPQPFISNNKDEKIKKFESLSYLLQTIKQEEGNENPKYKIRIFFFHGNSDDIESSNIARLWVLMNLSTHFPEKYQKNCEISCVSIDYPCFGISEDAISLLGSRELDDQIERLHEHLKLRDGYNVTWSISIGTRYAAALMKSSNIDFGYFQEPFFNISESSTLRGAEYYTGLPGEGISLLQGNPDYNILLHQSEGDTTFPPHMSKDKLYPYKTIVEKGKGKVHGWFCKAIPEGVLRTAEVFGKELGEILEKEDLIYSLVESSLREEMSPSSSSSEVENESYSSSSSKISTSLSPSPAVLLAGKTAVTEALPSSSSLSSSSMSEANPKLSCSSKSEASESVDSSLSA